MSTENITVPSTGPLEIALGRWIGRREAFALVAGRCTAADVASLKRMRDEGLHKIVNCTWAQFCTRHLHVSRRSADRLIGFLDEFGPAYFHITQLAHIAPNDYRQIKQHVSDEGINMDGKMVALLPENSGHLSAAIRELLSRIEHDAREGQPLAASFDVALKRCQSVIETLQSIPAALDEAQKLVLATAVAEITRLAAGLGIAG
jgi:hypothetical protein